MPKKAAEVEELEDDDIFSDEEEEQEEDLFADLDEDEEEADEDDNDQDDKSSDEDDDEVEFDPAAANQRLANIENTLVQIPNMIASALQIALGKSKQQVESDDDDLDEDDLQDPKKILSLVKRSIASNVKSQVDSAMQPHVSGLQQAAINAQFQNAAVKYGQHFIDNMTNVGKILKRAEGKMSVEDAYLAFREITGSGKSKTVGNKKKVSAQKFIARTTKTKVDADSKENVGSDREPRPKANSFKGKKPNDVFDAAFNYSINKVARSMKRR